MLQCRCRVAAQVPCCSAGAVLPRSRYASLVLRVAAQVHDVAEAHCAAAGGMLDDQAALRIDVDRPADKGAILAELRTHPPAEGARMLSQLSGRSARIIEPLDQPPDRRRQQIVAHWAAEEGAGRLVSDCRSTPRRSTSMAQGADCLLGAACRLRTTESHGIAKAHGGHRCRSRGRGEARCRQVRILHLPHVHAAADHHDCRSPIHVLGQDPCQLPCARSLLHDQIVRPLEPDRLDDQLCRSPAKRCSHRCHRLMRRPVDHKPEAHQQVEALPVQPTAPQAAPACCLVIGHQDGLRRIAGSRLGSEVVVGGSGGGHMAEAKPASAGQRS